MECDPTKQQRTISVWDFDHLCRYQTLVDGMVFVPTDERHRHVSGETRIRQQPAQSDSNRIGQCLSGRCAWVFLSFVHSPSDRTDSVRRINRDASLDGRAAQSRRAPKPSR